MIEAKYLYSQEKELVMEVLNEIASWGSPVGLGLLSFFSLVGTGVFFWGLSHFNKSRRKDKEERT